MEESRPPIIRYILIGLAVLVLIAVAIWLWMPAKQVAPSTSSSSPSLPVAGSSSTSTPTTGVGLTQGSDVMANIQKVLASPQTVQLGPDDYLLGVTGSRYVQQEFDIAYHAPDHSFAISLNREPLGQTRLDAEREFLALLGISEAEACTLHVNIGPTYSVNPQYADINLGFSFCPGATVLPE